jgi:hypothetical protein
VARGNVVRKRLGNTLENARFDDGRGIETYTKEEAAVGWARTGDLDTIDAVAVAGGSGVYTWYDTKFRDEGRVDTLSTALQIRE